MSSVVILSAIPLTEKFPAKRPLLVAISMIVVVTMLLTRSRGPLAAMLVGMATYWALRWPIGETLFVGLTCVLVVSVLILIFGDELSDLVLLGRTRDVTTLTGRLPLWEAMLAFIDAKPILGYGFNSFWTPAQFDEIAKYTNFAAADVHNSYLGLLLSVGYPGAILWCVVLAGGIVRSAQLHHRTRNPFYSYACAMLVYYASNALLLSVFLVEHLPKLHLLVVLVHIVAVTPSAKSIRSSSRFLPRRSSSGQRIYK